MAVVLAGAGGARSADAAPGARAAAGAVAEAGPAATAERPAVRSVACRSRCAGATAIRPGGLLRVRGRALGAGRTVVFLGARGRADDVRAPAVRVKPWRLDVRVPDRAVSGRIRVVAASGRHSFASRPTIRVLGGAPADARDAGPVALRVITRKAFFDGERPAGVELAVRAAHPVKVGVELVRTRDGASIRRWAPGTLAPGARRRITWDGRAGGHVQREGRYEFRVYSAATPADAAASPRATRTMPPAGEATGSFVFLRHTFPVQGEHSYGGFAASFGGGRGHQGQDVFAACGTPLVAARGGTVLWKATHERAGHYVVIDGEATGIDYAYMHLRAPALVERGARVRTGQLIGEVGDTGRASGCHLHFEMWRAPGWYRGGSPFDPLPSLRAWDRRS